MKIKMTQVVTAALAATFLFASCGKKDGGDDAGKKEEKVEVTADSVSDELVVQMNALADAIAAVKDKATAEEAAKKIAGVAEKVNEIASRMESLGDPSEADKKLVNEKLEKAEKAMGEKMSKMGEMMMSNEEVGKILMEAMQKFGESTKKMEGLIKKYESSESSAEEPAE